ncbi:MAG: hypothetical protein HC902_01240 [Calothrix sp. SM1_5_4]|nr:hypothetical protein [Calothrix sp. SM1_5_4]
MEIGLFQLENFFSLRAALLLDLRSNPGGSVHPEIDRYLASAQPVIPDEVENRLKSQGVDLEFPILLICENGESSARVARVLEAAGFNNVYVVSGGIEGLLSELR